MIKRLICVLAIVLLPACGLLLEEGRAVVAEVGGKPIRLEDLMRRIRLLPFEERARTSHPDKSVRLEARRRVLEDIVVDRLMVMEAEARGETVSDEEIEAALARERNRENLSGDLMQGAQGGTHAHERDGEEFSRRETREMREKILISKLSKKEFSDTAVQEFYEKHIDEFMFPSPLVNYEMVVVTPAAAEFVDTLYEKTAGKKITLIEIYDTLDQPPGILFAGITPTLPLNTLVPEMRKNVEKLKMGEISKPFHFRQNGVDQYGIAKLIRYVDKMPFQNVQNDLRARVRQEFIDRLKEKYKVEYHYDKLDYSVDR